MTLDHWMECLSSDESSDHGTHGKKEYRPLSPAPALAIDQEAPNDRPENVSECRYRDPGKKNSPKSGAEERSQDKDS
jgi:hypothetical protein